MKFFPIFLFVLFFPALVCAADIEIVEVQTGNAGVKSDECVKIKNNGVSPFALLGLILQSHSSNPDSTTWSSRSGSGLPEINITAGEIAVLASRDYTGADAIWRHTAGWGLSSDGGGMRLIDQNGNIIAEKYWGTLENLNQAQPEQSAPIAEPEPTPEAQTPTPEPQAEPEPPAEPELPAEQTEPQPQQFNNETIEQFNNGALPANAGEIPAKEIGIQISEFIPNPSGSDDGEWIEIQNLLNESSDIPGWLLDDEDGGSRPYKMPDGTIIPANGFLVFYKIQTKIALNNDVDSVRILKPAGETAEKTDYSGCSEGASYARGTNGWSWSTSPTPSLSNIITLPAPKKSSATSNPPATVYGEITKTNEASFYILEEDGDEIKINLPARNLAVGDKVEITGTVKKTASGNQITPKKQTDVIIKDKAPAEQKTAAQNPNLKYYIVLGIGLCSVAGMEGWKRRDLLKSKYKQIFNKSEALNPKSETNSPPEADAPRAQNTKT